MDDLPDFLKSFENLSSHFDEHFDPLASNERGDTFLELARKLVPLTDEGQGFGKPEISEGRSYDKGVDLFTATNDNNEILCIQSKYKIRDKSEFDTILSKFRDYEAQKLAGKSGLFPSFERDAPDPTTKFMVVTSSKLDGILAAYQSSYLASRPYYDSLVQSGRLIRMDGPRILGVLQKLYRKAHLLPTNIEISATSGWLTVGSVRLGTIRGSDLLSLYEKHGDSLFFENIRDFLGITSGKKAVSNRETVNDEIIRTIERDPEKMLERNNGITFRAERLEEQSEQKYVLHNGAIVNGCQTTMCLVHCGERSNDCLLQVKIVVTPEAWDIAKSANYQNNVARIELDLAKYLRPQIMKKVAADLGYAYEDLTSEPNKGGATASGILDAIYQNRVAYDEMKSLFLGLFSRRPNNLFDNNYTEVRMDVLEVIYRSPDREREIFVSLLKILSETRAAIKECERVYNSHDYASSFRRFFDEDRPRYRSMLAVLTLCGAHRDDISKRNADAEAEASRTLEFFDKTRGLLDNDPARYRAIFLRAFQVLAAFALDTTVSGEEFEISRNMLNRLTGTPFVTHYKKLLMQLDLDRDRLTE